MTKPFLLVYLIYMVLLNIFSAGLTVYDKVISKLPRGSVRRVPEKTFLSLSRIGGGIGVLFAMLTVRHKTKTHKDLVLQVAIYATIYTVITPILVCLP